MSGENNSISPNRYGTIPLSPHDGLGEYTRDSINELQHEQPETWFALVQSMEQDRQRKILSTMHQEGGQCLYKDILERDTVTKQSIRKHAKKLEENDLIERGGRPTVLSFPTIEIEALAIEALSLYYKTF